MPCVQINGHGALTHPELVDSHGGVVDQLDPADHAAGGTVKTADGASGGADLAKVKPHAAAEFADAGKVVDAAVDPVQTVRDGVDEAAG